MGKIAVAPGLIFAACLIASLLGIFQDVLTYQISAEWYEKHKFFQFGIPAQYRGLSGAAMVGVLATWWMGLILSVPVLIICVFAPDWRSMARIFLISCLIVLAVTLVAELGAYGFSLATLTRAGTPDWAQSPRFDDPLGVTHVQFINATGYLAAAIGAGLAMMFALWRVIRAQHAHRK